MARVDFYVLRDAGEAGRRTFACRLAEKAYRLEHAVHVCTADAAAASEIDALMWTFRDGSFVPHEIVSPGQTEIEAPVTIGALPPAAQRVELVINLANDIPEDCDDVPRIAEIVSSDESSRQQSRQRYARYRELGHTLETHKL